MEHTDLGITPAEALSSMRDSARVRPVNADNSKGVHIHLCEALLIATINYISLLRIAGRSISWRPA